MPVTELAFFTTTTSADGVVTPGFRVACAEALRVQDAWCAANLPGRNSENSAAEARGAALFQQLEDPTTTLLTAHWSSVAEHALWIASAENARVFGDLKSHVDARSIRFFHVDGVEAFPLFEEVDGDGGLTPALRSPVVSMTRCFVDRNRKDEFERVYAKVGGIYNKPRTSYASRGGWRIEKEPGREDVEEYVIVSGRDVPESADGVSTQEGLPNYADGMSSVMLGCDVKQYKRMI